MSFAAASAAAEAAAAAASAEVAQQAPARPATRTMLHAPWSFWHVNRDSGRGPRGSAKQSAAYGSSLSLVGDIETAEEFWGVYCYLSRVGAGAGSGKGVSGDVCLFRRGVRPMWEDEANARGGRVTLRVSKAASARYWEELTLALVGEQLAFGHSVCGAVLSSRPGDEDVLSVWTCDANDTQSVDKLLEAVRKLLCLAPSHNVEYRPHAVSASYAAHR